MAQRLLTGSFAAGDSGLDPEAANLDLKTKLSIVKKALLAERKKSQELESRLSLAEATIQERDVKIRELQTEKTELESALYNEQAKSREATLSSPRAKSAEMGSFNQTLTQEFHMLKQQNVESDREIADLQQEVKELTAALESRDVNLKRVLREYEDTQEQLKKQLSDSSQSLSSLTSEKDSLLHELDLLTSETRVLQSKLSHATDEIVALSAVKTDMQQVIDSLNESLISHAQNEALLAGKLMEMKSQLWEANSELKFEAVKINKLIDREAKITLRKGQGGICILEIDQKSRKKSYIGSSIADVSIDPSNPRRFTISLQVRVT